MPARAFCRIEVGYESEITVRCDFILVLGSEEL